jgi:hypothetical protein
MLLLLRVAAAVLVISAVARAAQGRVVARSATGQDIARQDHLKRCSGKIHAGFTKAERRRASHYARYAGISCARARAIVRLVDRTTGSYPQGYFWETPHGDPSTWPTAFGHLVRSAYLAPDGFRGTRKRPGVAVVLFS